MTIGEVAQVNYTERSISIEVEANSQPDRMPLTARKLHYYARIAYRAGRAEKLDPEPGVDPCVICRGVRVCDIQAHLALR